MECRNFLRKEKYDHLDERCKQRNKIKTLKKTNFVKRKQIK